jgi:hydrogenase nickel incorporation protein HypB
MTEKRIPVAERILGANDDLAAINRSMLDAHGVHAINIMASPGAGKTTLILRTAQALQGRRSLAVIEGDIASSVDADKVRAAGVPAVQINTGGNCHLDALQVRGALEQLPLAQTDLLLIENVGNLICPVAFDLGEHTRLAIASVPEGDDKPHKYPGIYSAVDVLALTKIDLLPYVPFDRVEFRRLVRSLNPAIRMFELSCVSGEGMDEWIAWLLERTPRGK